MDSNQPDQQQQPVESQQAHAGPSQLPDENYIEKLFPKCQPKPAQARGTNNQFRNKRLVRAADRQQQHKRQNRAKQQQQQQQQQQNLPRHTNQDNGLRRSRSSTDQPMTVVNNSHALASASNTETGETSGNLGGARQYCNSSDSSEKDANVIERQTELASLRRTSSSQHTFLANDQQREQQAAPQYNKSRTRKYRASKNLQQQLKRSQSSYSKLVGEQPLPIDPSDRNGVSPRDELHQSPIHSQQADLLTGQTRRNHNTNGVTNGRGTLNDSGAHQQPLEKVNRTNRGIVFAKPIATTNIASDSYQPVSVAGEVKLTQVPASLSNGATTTASAIDAAAQVVSLRSSNHAQHGQASATHNKTADSDVSKAQNGALIQVDGDGGLVATDIHPADYPNNSATICEPNAKVDNDDEDDIINLFVYDNSSPRKQDDKEPDKTPSITFKEQPNRLTNVSAEPRQHDSKTSIQQQLLGADLGEDDLISNDTSTEELCSFGDNDADIGLKIKPNSRPTKGTTDNDGAQTDRGSCHDIAPTSINKSILKHHRSMSTLQTVDEKAEINIDEEEINNSNNIQNEIDDGLDESTISKTKLAETTEATILKKSFVPPGFPQRVRPTAIDSVAENCMQFSQSSPTHVPIVSPTEDTILPMGTSSNTETQTNISKASDKIEASSCIQLESISMTEESQTVIERNLSEALNKVSLDAPTLRQLKLPNEASHFSAVRTTPSKTSKSSTEAPRSSIQFNTLSDVESGADDEQSTDLRHTIKSSQSMPKRQLDFAPSITRYASPGSSSRLDDDLTPTARTALVFPRLDEGLSSEAESCDDEVDDDDDKAMEADVDADDDDDEDDDADDNPTSNGDKISSSMQSSVDSFQQQSLKPQNRLVGNVQQLAQSRVSSEINQMKFGDFNTAETLEHEDLKPVPNYANQNGQSNYWMGASSQQSSLSSQPTSSNRIQHSNNNTGNNVNLSRSNSYVNREDVLIEGVLFNVKYLGSTHTECEGRGEKEDRIHQAELAVHEVKFRNGETHSPVEVQLFISTEKIMVLDDKHRKIMMDHSLRTISYIADIGDAIVLIVRKKSTSLDNNNDIGRPISKTSCHVFESNESHTITKSISQAFQVAYTELLKANGGGDGSNYLPKELDYQEVLNSQEMSMADLEMFASKENQREVIVPKRMGEILGLSIVESGWGSLLPTAVIASLKQDGPAYRCKKLSVGDQILSINGISLVGLSLAECQKILLTTKNQSVARLYVVPCPITVEVKIKRPDTKYQLGFSVQHGVICSLLRGGIAERGGVRVGHRIISINGTTVVGVPHDKIVTLLASSVGEIRMKTCLTSLYRHMLGEEKNISFV